MFIHRDLLFFVVLINPYAKNHKISYSLNYKLYEIDKVFWEILDLKENNNLPLSFHALGAWTAPTMQINEGIIEISNWNDDQVLDHLLSKVLNEMNDISLEVSKTINNIEKNLEFIEELYNEHLIKYPQSRRNIFKEQVMTAILKHDYITAQRISENRINERDTGGFMNGNKSFYEMTIDFLKFNVNS